MHLIHSLQSVLPAAAVLGVLIIIHEFGHFIACRFCGVKVEKFSIGFGPEILTWKGGETVYAVSLFPLGGYVKPAGESVSELGDNPPQKGDYLAAPLWSRMIIVAAGVLMNYILAYVLFVAIFILGRPVTGTTISSFVDGYPAKESGLKVGDKIMSVNEKPVKNWAELMDALHEAPEGPLALAIQRQGQVVPVSVLPKTEEVKNVFGEKFTAKRLGIMPSPEAERFERYGFIQALGAAWQAEVFFTTTTYKAIGFLILGKLSLQSISGPIGIISMTSDAAQLGLPYVLQITAALSISLAVINLLPIPALDGGHFLFLLMEAVRRKRVSLKVQENLTKVGFIFLLTLMAFILYNDLAKIDFFSRIQAFFQKI